VPLCPPQITHNLTRVQTRDAAVGSRRLTAWAMARSLLPWLLWILPVRRIWGSHSGDYEEFYILGYNAV
jgi:hypothetical protein